MSDKPIPLPVPAPAPRSVIAPPPAGQRVGVNATPRAVAPRSVFDNVPANVASNRAQAATVRQNLATAMQHVRIAIKAATDAGGVIKADSDAAAIFAHEGLTPEVFAKFSDLAKPLLDCFTAA